MLNSSSNWIHEYRFNSKNFVFEHPEIFQFIENNHMYQSLVDFGYLGNIRDFKINYVVDSNFEDPLEYLNEFIDIFYNRFEEVMIQPICQYFFKDESKNHLISKSTSATTHNFTDTVQFEKWIIDKSKDHLIYPYLLLDKTTTQFQYQFRVGTILIEHHLFSTR
jgi:hypothetical protein